jgi:hypothetical protein
MTAIKAFMELPAEEKDRLYAKFLPEFDDGQS